MITKTETRLTEYKVRIRAFIYTLSYPEAERVLAMLKGDPRTRWLSTIRYDAIVCNGYVINFDMVASCRRDNDDSADFCQNHLLSPLPSGTEIYDYYIM